MLRSFSNRSLNPDGRGEPYSLNLSKLVRIVVAAAGSSGAASTDLTLNSVSFLDVAIDSRPDAIETTFKLLDLQAARQRYSGAGAATVFRRDLRAVGYFEQE
jgi:hypothetical protein